MANESFLCHKTWTADFFFIFDSFTAQHFLLLLHSISLVSICYYSCFVFAPFASMKIHFKTQNKNEQQQQKEEYGFFVSFCVRAWSWAFILKKFMGKDLQLKFKKGDFRFLVVFIGILMEKYCTDFGKSH